ncbi:MAG: lipid II flippase MurJ [Melioribacteraceae bacterium]
MSVPNKSIIKPTIQLTTFSILGFAINLLSQIVVANYFGSSIERDSFFLATGISAFITFVFVGSFGNVFLPRLISITEDNQKTEFILSSFIIVFTLSLIIVIILIAFIAPIVDIIAIDYGISHKRLTQNLLILLSPSILFNTLANMLNSLYYEKHRFMKPAIVLPIVAFVNLFALFALFPFWGIFSLSFGALISSIVSVVLLAPIFYKKNFFSMKKFSLFNEHTNKYLNIVWPLLLLGLISRMSTILERMFATSLEVGSVSYLGYANQISLIVGTIAISGIGTSIYPRLANLWSNNNLVELTNQFRNISRFFFIIMIPIFIVILFLGNDVIKILFERGEFNHITTVAVSKTLIWYMFAMIIRAELSFTTKIFFISGKTGILSIISTLELIIFVGIAYFLRVQFSYLGIAISWFISNLFNYFASLYYIKSKILNIQIGELFYDLLKIIIVTFVSYGITFLLLNNLNIESTLLKVTCTGMLFVLIYIIIGNLVDINEIKYISNKFINKASRYF